MPDVALNEAVATVTEAKQAVTQAAEDIASNDTAAAESRLRTAEDRLAKLEIALAELRQAVESKAAQIHEHELPGHLRTLSDELSAIEAEEQSPKRSHALLKRIF